VIRAICIKGPPNLRPFGGAASIEPATEIALTCGNAEFDYAKRRETTRKYLRIREGF
jgi:hypothetical protein